RILEGRGVPQSKETAAAAAAAE
ncbi:hypothetical protein Tco_1451382, partial [Tanacetum coccineum]